MSWHYLQEAEVGYWEGNSLDGAPVALWRLSAIKFCQGKLGNCYASKERMQEVLRVLRDCDVTQEIWREAGRSVSIQKASILLSIMCEHEDKFDQARIFMACAKTLKSEMRSVPPSAKTAGASHRPKHKKQLFGEYSDLVQKLSRLLAHFGEKTWKDGSWENEVPCVKHNTPGRVDKLRALGNGQVPRVAAIAWHILTSDIGG